MMTTASALERSTPRRPVAQSGSTLIEVLVAMVILTFGLLGLAGLQATAMKSGYSAHLRTQASLLAHDMADRMRATRAAAFDGRYDEGSDHPDREAWDAAVTRSLGAGASGLVERVDGFVTITISWDDNRGRIRQGGAEDEAAQAFVYETEF